MPTAFAEALSFFMKFTFVKKDCFYAAFLQHFILKVVQFEMGLAVDSVLSLKITILPYHSCKNILGSI